MSIDYNKMLMYFEALALKEQVSGSGSDTIPAIGGGGGTETKLITIPHNYGSSKLIFRAMVRVSSFPSYSDYNSIPWAVTGLYFEPYVDSTNFYIKGTQTSGSSSSALDFDYNYWVFIP